MKRNTVIFECSGIGPKMLYSGSLGSKNPQIKKNSKSPRIFDIAPKKSYLKGTSI